MSEHVWRRPGYPEVEDLPEGRCDIRTDHQPHIGHAHDTGTFWCVPEPKDETR